MGALPLPKARDKAAAAVHSVDSTLEAYSSLTPELVIALCGPIGSPLHETAAEIENVLKRFNYQTVQIRLSELIRLNSELAGVPIDESSRFGQISTLIQAGDALRLNFGSDVLAKMAIAKIGGDRFKAFGDHEDKADESHIPESKKTKNQRVCHVIDSVKNSSELQLLRLLYGEALFAIGVFSPLEIRKTNLEKPGALKDKEIEQLIDTDSGEEFSHGQRVRDTFPQCDFFLRVDEPITGPSETRSMGQIVEKLSRLFNLIFRVAVVSPTTEENAMYSAASAARNSACLSRQVGAAVTSSSGELLAVGWNDVPQSGGGLYGKGRIADGVLGQDHRCYASSLKCHNDHEKKLIAEMIVERLTTAGVIGKADFDKAMDSISGDTKVKDLIEFSRAVHAEMHSILGASRVAGERVVGGKIFVTTYPCHSCARHIVASGIAEVYYIEPYRKSLATRLHADALTEAIDEDGKVKLLQFDGVAPRRFIDLFEAGTRKKATGRMAMPQKADAYPSERVSIRSIPRLEEVVIAEVTSKSLKLPEPVGPEEEAA